MNFKPNENFAYYLYWICERQNIFWKRYDGEQPPYTEDEILNKHKFTNVYKSLDRVTQFEFSNVIYNGKEYSKEDMFYRILIFKHFNLPETWNILEENLGEITIDKISFEEISLFLNEYQLDNSNFKPYNNAYMLTAAFLAGNKGNYVHLKGNGWKKYQYYFYIFEKEVFSNGYIYELLGSNTLGELYNKLIKVTSFAEFLTYQYVIDFNYSEVFNFDESELAIAGLGTVRGIERCFTITGKVDYGSVVMWVYNNFEQLLEDYGMYDLFKPLPNRMPQVPDLSNCFCETDKYMRGLGLETLEGSKEVSGKRIKQVFTESSNKISYKFPPKWGIEL